MKCTLNNRKFQPSEVAWLVSCFSLTLIGFLCSLVALLNNDWFHIYCSGTSNQAVSLTYRFGLWSFCGEDLSWIGHDNTTGSCVSIDDLVPSEPSKPSKVHVYIQGPPTPQSLYPAHFTGCLR